MGLGVFGSFTVGGEVEEAGENDHVDFVNCSRDAEGDLYGFVGAPEGIEAV